MYTTEYQHYYVITYLDVELLQTKKEINNGIIIFLN